MELKPGYIGIKWCFHDGKIVDILDDAQKTLHAAEICYGSKIIKIDSEDFSKELLISKQQGSKNYKIEVLVPVIVTHLAFDNKKGFYSLFLEFGLFWGL